MAETVKAVLFDYGLVLTGPADAGAWREMREITGWDEETMHRVYWAPRQEYDRGTLSGAQYWRRVGEFGGSVLDSGQIAGLIAADTALWTKLNEPMVAWARRLQRSGMRTGVLSNLGDAMTAGVLGECPWLAGFDCLIWSHTLGVVKPEPGIYAHAVAALRVRTGEVLFIDDRAENVAGAEAAGMQAIVYDTYEAFERRMTERGLSNLWLGDVA